MPYATGLDQGEQLYLKNHTMYKHWTYTIVSLDLHIPLISELTRSHSVTVQWICCVFCVNSCLGLRFRNNLNEDPQQHSSTSLVFLRCVILKVD